MSTNTPDQQITMPILPDAADNPVAFVNSVADIEPRLVRRYTNEADRTARMLALSANDLSTLATEGRAEIYDGTNHISLYRRSLFGFMFKNSDQTLTSNSTGHQNVTDMALAMPTAGSFVFRGVLFYQSSAVADIKFAFLVPAGAVMRWGGLGVAVGGGTTGDATFITNNGNDVSTPFGGAGAAPGGPVLMCLIEGVYVAGGTAGNLQLRAAQNTAEVSDSVVSFASRLEVWRYA